MKQKNWKISLDAGKEEWLRMTGELYISTYLRIFWKATIERSWKAQTAYICEENYIEKEAEKIITCS